MSIASFFLGGAAFLLAGVIANDPTSVSLLVTTLEKVSSSTAFAIAAFVAVIALFLISLPPPGAGAAAAEAAVNACPVTALSSHVGMSIAKLLAAKELHWCGERIGGGEGWKDLHVAQELAVLLKRSVNLRILDLTLNSLQDAGVRILARGLTGNMTLAVLTLDLNQIGDDGAAALAEVLPSTWGLTELYLNQNLIRQEGAAALAKALPSMWGLTELWLGRNPIGREGAAELRAAKLPIR